MNDKWIGEPVIKKYFESSSLVEQPVYKASTEYVLIYVNSKIYEDVFDKKFDWDTASKDVAEYFSVTLDINASDKAKVVGTAVVDKQYDPLNIASNGNAGSGRAFYFQKYFNIKGDKTVLATSKNKKYNHGKLSLSNAFRECILSNILADDFVYPSFATFAILYKKEDYNFLKKSIIGDTIVDNLDNILPCALIVRVNPDNILYRFTNAFSDNRMFSKDELISMSKRVGILEANKFMDRFLHGSWSGGNLSIDMNMIDFDTSFFVKNRHPQYSVTPWHKNNYFGNELIGQAMVIQSIIDNGNASEPVIFDELKDIMNQSYRDAITVRFCDLMGLDYNAHYEKYKKKIDDLVTLFNELSRKCLPNYSELCNTAYYCDNTALFDFSNFFRFYLVYKSQDRYTNMDGMNLLCNKALDVDMSFDEEITDCMKEFFADEFVQGDDAYHAVLLSAIAFIRKYDSLFDDILQNENIESKLMKAYVINEDRPYLTGDYDLARLLSDKYVDKAICEEDFNSLLSVIIEANKRNHDFDKETEFITNLTLYKDCMTYFVIGFGHYRFVVVPFKSSKIDTASVVIDDVELQMMFREDEGVFETENVSDADCYTTVTNDVMLILNREIYSGQPFAEKIT